MFYVVTVLPITLLLFKVEAIIESVVVVIVVAFTEMISSFGVPYSIDVPEEVLSGACLFHVIDFYDALR